MEHVGSCCGCGMEDADASGHVPAYPDCYPCRYCARNPANNSEECKDLFDEAWIFVADENMAIIEK